MFHLWCVSICVYTPISYNIKNINIKILLGFGFSLRNSASMASLCMASQALCRVCGGVWHPDIGSRSFRCHQFLGGASLDLLCSSVSHRCSIGLEIGGFVGRELGAVWCCFTVVSIDFFWMISASLAFIWD